MPKMLSTEELELIVLAEQLVKALRSQPHDTRRYSSIFNLAHDIYRKSLECTPNIDPEFAAQD